MRTASSVLQAVAGIAGLTLIVLGVLFWTGHAYQLLSLHMGLGIVLVLALWVQAVLAARTGVGAGMVVFALIWGAVVFAFGMVQTRILPGEYHWMVRVLHLVFGIIAMQLVGRLGMRVRGSAAISADGSRTGREAGPFAHPHRGSRS